LPRATGGPMASQLTWKWTSAGCDLGPKIWKVSITGSCRWTSSSACEPSSLKRSSLSDATVVQNRPEGRMPTL
jgi:hypothetical protein